MVMVVVAMMMMKQNTFRDLTKMTASEAGLVLFGLLKTHDFP